MKCGIGSTLHTNVPFRVGTGPIESIPQADAPFKGPSLSIVRSVLEVPYISTSLNRVGTGSSQSLLLGENVGQKFEVPYILIF